MKSGGNSQHGADERIFGYRVARELRWLAATCGLGGENEVRSGLGISSKNAMINSRRRWMKRGRRRKRRPVTDSISAVWVFRLVCGNNY